MRIEHELITPDRATELLGLNYEGQRKRRHPVVERYASDMKAGDWRPTGDTIKISASGSIVDGQHRLAAVISADISIWMWVAYDVPDDSYDVLDIGLKRTLSDILHARHVPNSTSVAAAVGGCEMYVRQGHFRSSGRNATPSALIKIWEANQGIADHSTSAARIYNAMRYPPGSFMAMAYVFSLTKTEDVDTFMLGIATGNGLLQGDPIFALRRVLLDRMATPGNKRYDIDHYNACVVRGWNSYARGEQTSVVRGRINGKFPEVFDPHGTLEEWVNLMR